MNLFETYKDVRDFTEILGMLSGDTFSQLDAPVFYKNSEYANDSEWFEAAKIDCISNKNYKPFETSSKEIINWAWQTGGISQEEGLKIGHNFQAIMLNGHCSKGIKL